MSLSAMSKCHLWMWSKAEYAVMMSVHLLLRAVELKICAFLFVELSQYKQRQPSTTKPNGAEHGGVLSYLEA